jgi:hypothetical protein
MQQAQLDAFSNAADYIKSATNFFLTGFEFGASAFEKVRDRIDSLKRNDPPPQVQQATPSGNIFKALIEDRDKAIAVVAISILAAGIILVVKR